MTVQVTIAPVSQHHRLLCCPQLRLLKQSAQTAARTCTACITASPHPTERNTAAVLSMLPEAHLAFVRTDRYGEGGWAPQPLWERARLAVLAFTLLPLRVLLTLTCVASYYLIVRIATIIPNEIVVRRIITLFGKLWCRACLFCLGFVHIKWVRVGGTSEPRSSKRRSVALVSNHLSWADILIQMARYFPAFVARDGTQNLPMIGLISRRMQCIYVDREKKAAAGTAAVNGDSSSSSSGRPLAPGRAAAVAAAGGDAAGAPAADVGGVSGAVRRRMLLTAEQPELELRPMLLFPEGTTTNGRCLLPFKTGAFLAGVPVLPTIIHYHTSSGSNDLCCSSAARALAAAAVAAAAAAAAGLAASNGASSGAAAAAGLAAAGVAAVLGGSALMGVGGVSPAWESIDASRHLLLMACQPFHTVTCYELPLYTPSAEEQADPRLYAANVRQYMLQQSAQIAADAAARRQRRQQHKGQQQQPTAAAAAGMPLLPSPGLLEDKREYQAGLKARKQEIEGGKWFTAQQLFPVNPASSSSSKDGKQQQQRQQKKLR